MRGPDVRYYCALKLEDTEGVTPKYRVTHTWGDYPPMASLVNADGLTEFYLLRGVFHSSPDAPTYRLQGKGNINFSGLNDFYTLGRLSGWAYGCPTLKKTYRNGKAANPFFAYRYDGYLFQVEGVSERGADVPRCLELLVYAGGRDWVAANFYKLKRGAALGVMERCRREAVAVEVPLPKVAHDYIASLFGDDV